MLANYPRRKARKIPEYTARVSRLLCKNSEHADAITEINCNEFAVDCRKFFSKSPEKRNRFLSVFYLVSEFVW